ncbi:hypothetical protein ES703_08165 [subsurface metagenome]
MHQILQKRPSFLKKTLNHLYWRRKLPMVKIGELFGVSSATICRCMKKFGIKVRTPSETSMKYQKLPFSGSPTEKAYLLGLMGDLHARYHRLQINVSLTTTHPAMVRLFESCFGKYGHVNKYPMLNPDFRYCEWYCYCNLHPSFSFLTVRDQKLSEQVLNTDELFYHHLSGIIDSEGFIGVSKCSGQRREYIRVLIGISSTDLTLLKQVAQKLRSLGYSAKVREAKSSTNAFKGKRKLWNLRIERKSDVFRVLPNLKLRHQEKSEWGNLALKIAERGYTYWGEVASRVMDLRRRIDREVQLCKTEAKKMYVVRHSTVDKASYSLGCCSVIVFLLI